MPFLTPPFSIADRVDAVFLYIFVLSVAFLISITSVMIYFVIRYSRKRNTTPVDIEGHAWLEVTWTAIPLVLFLSMFYYGWTNFAYMRNAPSDAMVVEVVGRQWAWSFTYPNGKTADEMYVAVNRPVKVELHSQDVLHGFYIAAFRVKADVVPGKTNYLWFTPTVLGTFDVQCTVMCGVHHSYMLSKVHVLPEAEFKAWYFAEENAPAAGQAEAVSASPPSREEATLPKAVAAGARGLALLQEKTCLACHTVDGAMKVGPTYKGLFGKKEVVVADGKEREITVDEAYLRRSIKQPLAEVVKGYPPVMPTLPVTDEEIDEIIAYLKTLT
jgi:cytochrome c oxidase subunit 2